jgi:hypothetical protein
MELKEMKRAAEQFKSLVKEIHENHDYQLVAIEYGKLNSKLNAVCIGNSQNWEELSARFQDLQARVDEYSRMLTEIVLSVSNKDEVTVSVAAIRVLNDVGITVILDINLDSDKPFSAYGVFEVFPNLRFAI